MFLRTKDLWYKTTKLNLLPRTDVHLIGEESITKSEHMHQYSSATSAFGSRCRNPPDQGITLRYVICHLTIQGKTIDNI